MSNHDGALATVERAVLEQPLDEAPVLVVGRPHRLLGVVRLVRVLPLHLQGDDEVLGRVGVRLARLAQFDVAWHLGQMVVVGRWWTSWSRELNLLRMRGIHLLGYVMIFETLNKYGV